MNESKIKPKSPHFPLSSKSQNKPTRTCPFSSFSSPALYLPRISCTATARNPSSSANPSSHTSISSLWVWSCWLRYCCFGTFADVIWECRGKYTGSYLNVTWRSWGRWVPSRLTGLVAIFGCLIASCILRPMGPFRILWGSLLRFCTLLWYWIMCSPLLFWLWLYVCRSGLRICVVNS